MNRLAPSGPGAMKCRMGQVRVAFGKWNQRRLVLHLSKPATHHIAWPYICCCLQSLLCNSGQHYKHMKAFTFHLIIVLGLMPTFRFSFFWFIHSVSMCCPSQEGHRWTRFTFSHTLVEALVIIQYAAKCNCDRTGHLCLPRGFWPSGWVVKRKTVSLQMDLC